MSIPTLSTHFLARPRAKKGIPFTPKAGGHFATPTKTQCHVGRLEEWENGSTSEKNGFFNQGESWKSVLFDLNRWTSMGIKTTRWWCPAVRVTSPHRTGGNPMTSMGHTHYIRRRPVWAKLDILSVRLVAYVVHFPRDTKCHQTSIGLLPVKSAGRAGSTTPTEMHGCPSATFTAG